MVKTRSSKPQILDPKDINAVARNERKKKKEAKLQANNRHDRTNEEDDGDRAGETVANSDGRRESTSQATRNANPELIRGKAKKKKNNNNDDDKEEEEKKSTTTRKEAGELEAEEAAGAGERGKIDRPELPAIRIPEEAPHSPKFAGIPYGVAAEVSDEEQQHWPGGSLWPQVTNTCVGNTFITSHYLCHLCKLNVHTYPELNDEDSLLFRTFWILDRYGSEVGGPIVTKMLIKEVYNRNHPNFLNDEGQITLFSSMSVLLAREESKKGLTAVSPIKKTIEYLYTQKERCTLGDGCTRREATGGNRSADWAPRDSDEVAKSVMSVYVPYEPDLHVTPEALANSFREKLDSTFGESLQGQCDVSDDSEKENPLPKDDQQKKDRRLRARKRRQRLRCKGQLQTKGDITRMPHSTVIEVGPSMEEGESSDKLGIKLIPQAFRFFDGTQRGVVRVVVGGNGMHFIAWIFMHDDRIMFYDGQKNAFILHSRNESDDDIMHGYTISQVYCENLDESLAGSNYGAGAGIDPRIEYRLSKDVKADEESNDVESEPTGSAGAKPKTIVQALAQAEDLGSGAKPKTIVQALAQAEDLGWKFHHQGDKAGKRPSCCICQQRIDQIAGRFELSFQDKPRRKTGVNWTYCYDCVQDAVATGRRIPTLTEEHQLPLSALFFEAQWRQWGQLSNCIPNGRV